VGNDHIQPVNGSPLENDDQDLPFSDSAGTVGGADKTPEEIRRRRHHSKAGHRDPAGSYKVSSVHNCLEINQ